MTTESEESWRSKASIQRLPIIVDLLYGFAIGNGLSDAIKGVVTQFDWIALVLLVLATIMAFSEWLAYHVHVSPLVYTGVTRLLLDMTFPMMIYLVLLAPTLSNQIYSAAYVSTVLFVYFSGAIWYAKLMDAEAAESDPSFKGIILVCTGTAFIAATIGWLSFAITISKEGKETAFWLALAADLISMATILYWSQYNIRCVRATMRRADVS